MHVVVASFAFDLSPNRRVHILHSAMPGLQRGLRLLGVAIQGVLFFAVLWLLAAGPGFLSARDSLVPSGTDRLAHQASR